MGKVHKKEILSMKYKLCVKLLFYQMAAYCSTVLQNGYTSLLNSTISAPHGDAYIIPLSCLFPPGKSPVPIGFAPEPVGTKR
jgi:hypothetical protein